MVLTPSFLFKFSKNDRFICLYHKKVITLHRKKTGKMAANRRISNEVMRLLYAHSGNRCAYPNCHAPIFEEDGLLTAECCHIKAFSPGGPRYDALQTDEERNSGENLILLCTRHHRIVDADEKTYTVELLCEYKQRHEQQYSASTLKLTDDQLKYLQMNSDFFWKKIEEIDHANSDWLDLKIMVDVDGATSDLLNGLESLLHRMEEYFDELEKYDNTLAQRIREYLLKIGVEITKYDNQTEYPNVNPFDNPHWEMFAYGTHNSMNELWMLYLQLVVRALEHISVAERKEHPLLQQYRERLTEFQKHSYYRD